MDVIWDPFGVLHILFSTHILDTMVKELFLSIFGPDTTVKIDVSPRRELDFHENPDFDNWPENDPKSGPKLAAWPTQWLRIPLLGSNMGACEPLLGRILVATIVSSCFHFVSS